MGHEKGERKRFLKGTMKPQGLLHSHCLSKFFILLLLRSCTRMISSTSIRCVFKGFLLPPFLHPHSSPFSAFLLFVRFFEICVRRFKVILSLIPSLILELRLFHGCSLVRNWLLSVALHQLFYSLGYSSTILVSTRVG